MKRFVEEYKGFRVYHDSDEQSTAPRPCWIIKGETTEYSLCGVAYTLIDVKKFIDGWLLGIVSYDYVLPDRHRKEEDEAWGDL